MNVKSCILALFRPEKIYFLQKIKKKMLILAKDYYIELQKIFPLKLAMAQARH